MQKKQILTLGTLAFLALGATIFISGCGSKPESTAPAGETATTTGEKTAPVTGTLTIDGSSTVYPIVNIMAEDFGTDNNGAKATVSKSGTGSGMQKFSRGEIDIATASRPIQQKEIDALKAAKIDFIEVPIAYDGVCVIVNPANKADKITPAELKAAWSAESKAATWADVHAGWPAEKINFFGPTDNHGTYEYFTEAINKKKGNIRKDYQPNQDYNVVVSSVAGDKNGFGYVGFNYYINNKDKVKVVPVDAGKGAVAPSEETITNGTYTPLSRPLFLYVNKAKYESNASVKAFVQFALGAKGSAAVKEANYVQLPAEALAAVKAHVDASKTGSLFQGVEPGMTIQQVLAKESAK